jgi:hypothetical protein
MKASLYLLMLCAALSGVAFATGTTRITDFSCLLGTDGTCTSTAFDHLSISLTKTGGATLTSSTLIGTQAISLQAGSLAFGLSSSDTTDLPALNSNFSIILSFDLSSLSSSNTASTLFSTNYYNRSSAFDGLYGAQYSNGGIHIGYWSSSSCSSGFGSTDPTISLNGATSGILTLVFSHYNTAADGHAATTTSYSAYLNSKYIGGINSNSGQTFTVNVNNITVGGKGTCYSSNMTNSFSSSSDLTLLGLEIMTASAMDSAAFQTYYSELTANAVPEPTTAALTLLGLGFFVAQRKRTGKYISA